MIELRCDAKACSNLDNREKIAYLQAMVNLLRIRQKSKADVGVGYVKEKSGTFLKRRFGEVLEPAGKPSRAIMLIASGVCIGLFFLSYAFVIQPAAYPRETAFAAVVPTADGEEKRVTEFLMRLSDGTYTYFRDGKEIANLGEKKAKQSKYVDLPVFDAWEE